MGSYQRILLPQGPDTLDGRASSPSPRPESRAYGLDAYPRGAILHTEFGRSAAIDPQGQVVGRALATGAIRREGNEGAISQRRWASRASTG